MVGITASPGPRFTTTWLSSPLATGDVPLRADDDSSQVMTSRSTPFSPLSSSYQRLSHASMAHQVKASTRRALNSVVDPTIEHLVAIDLADAAVAFSAGELANVRESYMNER
jgi:hypothetical protein